MVSVRLFLFILMSMVCREFATGGGQQDIVRAAIAWGGVAMGFGLIAKLSAVAIARKACGVTLDANHRFVRFRAGLDIGWLLLLPATLIATSWLTAIGELEAAGTANVLVLILLFAPTILYVALVEIAAAQLDEYGIQLENDTRSTNGRASDQDANPPLLPVSNQRSTHWTEIWRLRLRLGEFSSLLMCLLPALAIAAASDASTLLGSSLPKTWQVLLGTVTAVGLIATLFPVLVSRWTGVRPLSDSQLAGTIRDTCRLWKIAGLRLRMVPSEGRWHVAAVVGWLPYVRYLWLGDALMTRLDQRQLEMVVLHELAHVRRKHFLWRLLPICVAAALAVTTWSMGSLEWQSDALRWAVQVVGMLTATTILVLGVGEASRRCELDADAEACTMAQTSCSWACESPRAAESALASALRELIGEGSPASKRTWLHPSLHERIKSLAARRSASSDLQSPRPATS